MKYQKIWAAAPQLLQSSDSPTQYHLNYILINLICEEFPQPQWNFHSLNYFDSVQKQTDALAIENF